MIFNTVKEYCDYVNKIKTMTPDERADYFNKNQKEKNHIYTTNGNIFVINPFTGVTDSETYGVFNSLLRLRGTSEMVVKIKEATDGYFSYYLVKMKDGTIKLYTRGLDCPMREVPVGWLDDSIKETESNLKDLKDLKNIMETTQ